LLRLHDANAAGPPGGRREPTLARKIDRAPQVPRRRRAIGRPALAPGGEGARRRHAAQAVGEAKSIAYAEVVDRQHVGAAELEHQQHLDRPPADTAHLREPLDDLFAVECDEYGAVRHDAAAGLGREVLEARDLCE